LAWHQSLPDRNAQLVLQQGSVRGTVEVGGRDAAHHDGVDVTRKMAGPLEELAGRSGREVDGPHSFVAEAPLAEPDESPHPAVAGLEELGLLGAEPAI